MVYKTAVNTFVNINKVDIKPVEERKNKTIVDDFNQRFILKQDSLHYKKGLPIFMQVIEAFCMA